MMSLAFSIGKAERTSLKKSCYNNVPGPGSYNSQIHLNQKQPQWGFNKAKRLKENNISITPGPGAYEQSSITNKKIIAKTISFRFKTHHDQINNDMPGPNQYRPNTANLSKNQPQYTIANKNFPKQLFNTPGVGLYNISNWKCKNNVKIAQQKRALNILNINTPGPGNYISNSGFNQYTYANHKFGNQKRLNDKITNDNPGPGSYNIRNNVDSRFSQTISGKFNSYNNKDGLPGPGSYNPEKKKKVFLCTMGKTQKEMKIKKEEYHPAPNQYKPQAINRPQSASFSIGKGNREIKNQVEDYPGPGQYLKTEFMNDGPKYVIQSKYEKKPDIHHPGPQDYAPQQKLVKNKSPTYTIPSQSRLNTTTNNIPGVGTYNINTNTNLGNFCTIPTSNNNHTNLSTNPGPGEYDIPSKFAQTNKYQLDPSNTRSQKYLNQSIKKTQKTE